MENRIFFKKKYLEIFYEQEKFEFEENSHKRNLPKSFESSKLLLIYTNNKIKKRQIISRYLTYFRLLDNLLRNFISKKRALHFLR